MNNKFLDTIDEIVCLLDEAYDHYFNLGSGGGKMAEGLIEVYWPNYFERKRGNTEPTVGVYSYVFCPSRMHFFDTVEEALTTVKRWHDFEMKETYGL